MLESKIQAKLIKKYEAQGYYVVKLIQTNKNGIPDLLLIKNGIATFVEVKSETQRLTELQKYRADELRRFGCEVREECE